MWVLFFSATWRHRVDNRYGTSKKESSYQHVWIGRGSSYALNVIVILSATLFKQNYRSNKTQNRQSMTWSATSINQNRMKMIPTIEATFQTLNTRTRPRKEHGRVYGQHNPRATSPNRSWNNRKINAGVIKTCYNRKPRIVAKMWVETARVLVPFDWGIVMLTHPIE